MVTFPLSLALIPFTIVLLLVMGVASISTLHLIRYGATTKVSFVVTFAFFAGTVLLLFFTWFSLRGVDWQQPVTIGSSTPATASPLF